MKNYLSLASAFMLLLLLVSCAQGPSGQSFSQGGSTADKNYITFTLTFNETGSIASNGYYLIMLNSEAQPIEVTNTGTYTDALRLYNDPLAGPTYYWLHRIPSVPGPGYEFVYTARIDQYAQISSDSRTLSFTFSTKDSSVIFNQYIFNRFTAQALTTDNFSSAMIGRTLDTMGPGPDITHSDLYTVMVNKTTGPENPLPPNYPDDELYDWATKGDLPADFPYVNFDIKSFQIYTY
ncbi:MAG: hypothetical protein RDV48_13625 [Candidatus Eremiobacteraeota bacterium]|nr:hypothetical protein [Candidatus Eremiobacteraeota bacterium]